MQKENFFDRKIYLEFLEKHIKDLKDGYRQNIALLGDELVGKTSIIFNLLNRFYDPRIILIYLEIRPEAVSSFVKRFIGVLLYNFLLNSNIKLKEDLDFLINKSLGHIPKTIEKIKLILSSLDKKKNDIFPDLLSLCEIINQETNKFCVVIFDEFHNLEKIGIKKIYYDWSKLLISQKNTMYIIISSMRCRAKAILAKDLSLLFGNFKIMDVEPFDIKTSEEYLSLRLGELDINAGFKNFIVHFTGGYPFYLEVVSGALLKSDKASLTDTLEELLILPSGILYQRFSIFVASLLDGPYGQECLDLLYQISCGHNKFKDILHMLPKPKKELDIRINYLLESDIIKRSGDFLKLGDRVFAFWLRFVYQEKLQSLTFNANKQKESFRQNIENMLQEFILSAKKPIIERMSELLCLFEDEIIQIERKKVRLNHFREIKPLEFNRKGLRDGLIGRSNDSLWIMAFKHDSLTEDDISEFAKECKKYRHKLQRKIMLTFKDIETNARLKAMEEKIWTWDLNNLNQLLDLFYKPRIIV